MQADAAHPERGQFVRDQVGALQRLPGVEELSVELYEFPPGAAALARAALELRRRFGAPRARRGDSGRGGFDVVHAHYGLTAWPALAVPARVRALTVHGTDLHHPRTRLATRAVLGLIDLPAAVSAELAGELPGAARRRAEVLPCGVDLERFKPLPRAEARSALGLDRDRTHLLFPADPARPEKRHDRALELARAVGAELLALGGVEPARVPLLVSAADAVLVPSEREGFGLAVLEALAAEVPVLATPVGIHADALAHVSDTLCAPFELTRWSAFLEELLRRRAGAANAAAVPSLLPAGTIGAGDISGRQSAARYSAAAMAERVAAAWRSALHSGG